MNLIWKDSKELKPKTNTSAALAEKDLQRAEDTKSFNTSNKNDMDIL